MYYVYLSICSLGNFISCIFGLSVSFCCFSIDFSSLQNSGRTFQLRCLKRPSLRKGLSSPPGLVGCLRGDVEITFPEQCWVESPAHLSVVALGMGSGCILQQGAQEMLAVGI